jgi:small GTP-binding protein
MAATSPPVLKVVVLGEGAVGKTSLITRWSRDSFSDYHLSTIGTGQELATVFTDGVPIRVALWDTAGQVSYRNISKLASRAADCGVFVAAVDDADSFVGLSVRVNDFFEVNDRLCPVVLVVNKVDVEESKWYFTTEEILEKYGKSFASVFFVSAMTNQDVPVVLEYIARIAGEYRESRPKMQVVGLKGTRETELTKDCKC